MPLSCAAPLTLNRSNIGKKEISPFGICIKMQRGRKELDAIGARSLPVLKIGDRYMIGWNPNNFEKMYNSN
jgi:hypothetical protein